MKLTRMIFEWAQRRLLKHRSRPAFKCIVCNLWDYEVDLLNRPKTTYHPHEHNNELFYMDCGNCKHRTRWNTYPGIICEPDVVVEIKMHDRKYNVTSNPFPKSKDDPASKHGRQPRDKDGTTGRDGSKDKKLAQSIDPKPR